LNDADEVCVQQHEERGQSKKRNDKIERARYRVAVDYDSRAENQHQQSEDPEKDGSHYKIADCRLRIAD
jgi:hypothetical protein